MYHIKISSMREFITLAELRNFNLAAERMFLSQPTLSRHIKDLEDELDVQLFERSTRRVELTEGGEYLLPYAKRIVKAEDEYNEGLSAYRRPHDDGDSDD